MSFVVIGTLRVNKGQILPAGVCLFVVLTLYVPSTIFQLDRDGSSWVEPVLS